MIRSSLYSHDINYNKYKFITSVKVLYLESDRIKNWLHIKHENNVYHTSLTLNLLHPIKMWRVIELICEYPPNNGRRVWYFLYLIWDYMVDL